MFLITHFILAVIFSFFLFPLFGWDVWLIVLGGTFIDLDHFITNSFRFKKPKDILTYFSKQFRFFMRKPEGDNKVRLYPFHSIEFLVVLTILALFFRPAFLILIGVVFHLISDLISDTFILKRFIRYFSIIGWLRKGKGL